MSALVGLFVVAASLITLAGAFKVLVVLGGACRDQWSRIPRERRPRAVAAGAATALLITVAIVLAITAPWGPDSIVYVILVGFGGLMLGVLLAVAIQAVQDGRRARNHHRGHT